MASSHRPRLVFPVLGLASLLILGCQEREPALPPSVTPPPPASDQASHDDHDHDHDHPDHGPHGGHMVELGDGSKAEVDFADDLDMFSIWVDNPESVTKVEMITTIDEKVKTYPFENQKTFDSIIFALTDPELSTAVMMGEGVDVKLVIAREEGEVSGTFEHHSH